MPRPLWLLLFPALLLASDAIDADRRAAIDRLVSEEMSRQNIPGLSLAVGHGGKVLWAGAYGLSDLENFVPVKTSTVFRLASISKPITATAALQLWESGRLNLDAPIQQYVPSFPVKSAPVTPRLLLGHLGGIRHYNGAAEINSTRHYHNRLDPLAIFQNDPLANEPGTAFLYSTYGYNLLGAAVEAAAGQQFAGYLRNAIFNPAGMATIRPDHTFAIIPNRARGYAKSSTGELQNCALADTSNKIPGGGLISTPTDLVQFALALQAGKLIKPATFRIMFTPQKLKDGKFTDYGLGWRISSVEGTPVHFHTGGQQGTSTILLMLPNRGPVVALMSNLEGAVLRDLATRIARLIDTARARN